MDNTNAIRPSGVMRFRLILEFRGARVMEGWTTQSQGYEVMRSFIRGSDAGRDHVEYCDIHFGESGFQRMLDRMRSINSPGYADYEFGDFRASLGAYLGGD